MAPGGLPASPDGDKYLEALRSGRARVVVVSNRPPPEGGDAAAPAWQVDDFKAEAPPAIADEAIAGLLTALAVLNRPLAPRAIEQLARDFGLERAGDILRDFLAAFGGRYVVKAALAERLRAAAAPDELRAAHRACLDFMARVPHLFDAPPAVQLTWRLRHARGAREDERARLLAEEAIAAFNAEGSYTRIAGVYRTLGRERSILAVETRAHVAFALIQLGEAQRARDVLRQIPASALERPGLRLRLRVLEAEALRNLPDHSSHLKAI